MKAYALIKIVHGHLQEVKDQVEKIKGVNRCEAVTGPPDLISVIEGASETELEEMKKRIWLVKNVTHVDVWRVCCVDEKSRYSSKFLPG